MNLIMPILELPTVEPALEFYRDILGFEQKFLERDEASGKVMAAELHFGKAPLFLILDEQSTVRETAGGGISLYLYTEDDLDAYCERLRNAGVTISVELQDQYWGDRTFGIVDPHGIKLTFANAITMTVAAPEGRIVEIS